MTPLAVGSKVCRHCGATKLQRDFGPNSQTLDGLSSWCRDCHRAASLAWWTPERKAKAKHPPLPERNCPTCGVLFVPRAATQPSCGTRRCQPSYGASTHVRKARERGARVDARIYRRVVFERDGWICRICGEPTKRDVSRYDPLAAQIDHIVPLSRGGAHGYDNLRTAHRACNIAAYSRSQAA